jgi:hypothetical protein
MSQLQAGASVLAAAVAATGALGVLEHWSGHLFGLPLQAVTAAMVGALIPTLLLDPEPWRVAVRRWLGSVALALVATGLVLQAAALDKPFAVGVAGLVAAFARELFAGVRGELGPFLSAVRQRLVGNSGAPKTPGS